LSNFSFLDKDFKDLATVSKVAENYVHAEPKFSLVQARIFSEQVVKYLYKRLNISPPRSSYKGFSFNDYLDNPAFVKLVPQGILNTLHIIRKSGNEAAHEVKEFKPEYAQYILQRVYSVSGWLYQSFIDKNFKLLEFRTPLKPTLKLDKDEQEVVVKDSIETVEKTVLRTEINEEQVLKVSQEIKQKAEILGLTESQTRKDLIDLEINKAEWIIKKLENYDQSSLKPQALIEYPVKNLITTKSGTGFIDYVLMGKNGKPIAIIEAKKTSESVDKGKTQAEDYANGLEKEFGQRPFIYYTNGREIYFWDDLNYPPRKVWGYFDLDKLEYMLHQREHKHKLSETLIDTSIVERPYQLEGIRRVYERFENHSRRKALVVMATGTGKTRLTVAMVKGLMQAGWAKRVLFLVDRLELQRQAKDAFKEFLPTEKVVTLNKRIAQEEQDARIFISTYPTISNSYENFNVGFFDLLIADESHRSIYKSYREVFQYFDSFQVGLTATPLDFVSRNTFNLFECEAGEPTFNYTLAEAINNKPPFLVNFRASEKTTAFIKKGIKYTELTEEQKQELEDAGEEPEKFQFEPSEVHKTIHNTETCRIILRDFMERGIKDKTGTRPGKTIIFARSQSHAELLLRVFDELYPEHKGKMARAIHYAEPKAQSLIDGFKGKNEEFKDIQIAISVDMLDTGIDIPEVVNLVFAKPVYSKAKFWQMIGRGTRLCKNLFGKGKDKEYFQIFDYWENFSFFDLKPDGAIPSEQKSTPELLFKNRIALLKMTLGKEDSLEIVDDLKIKLKEDIALLPTGSITIKEKWKELEYVQKEHLWQKPNEEFFKHLEEQISPLMRWRDIQQQSDAIEFDNKITQAQKALIEGNKRVFELQQNKIINDVSRLRTNLDQVAIHQKLIDDVLDFDWWKSVSYSKLEDIRLKLRDLMKYRSNTLTNEKYIDISEGVIEVGERFGEGNASVFEFEAYKKKFVEVLKDLASQNLVLQKIRRGRKITDSELKSLKSLILQRDSGLSLDLLEKLFPGKVLPMDKMIRSLIGMDELTVKESFDKFRENHNNLTANQLQFLALLEQEISKSGGIELEQLYAPPFTRIHNAGIEGVFNGETDEIINIIKGLTG
jgi:type I restriction enzyme R subunit